MTRRWSIALRLAAWLSIATAIFWIGAASISSAVLRQQLDQAFDENLRQSATRLLPLALRNAEGNATARGPVPRIEPKDGPRAGAPDPAPPVEGGLPFLAGQETFTYLVYDSSGTVVVRADDAPDTLTSLPEQDGFAFVDGHRAFVSSDRRTGLNIVVLETSGARAQATWQAIAGLFWPLAALLPLMALCIWLAVRATLRPVERLSMGIAVRDSGNLTPISDEGQPRELAPIASEVAALLERLRAAMEAERAFAATSAHELRTPIAGALAQSQRLSAELGDHPAAARVQGIERALRNLSDLAERMLQMARLEAGFARSEVEVDLLPVLTLVLRDFESNDAAERRLAYRQEGKAPLMARINPDAFALAMRNLINNAIIHGAPYEIVEVVWGDGRSVRVRNHGPIVEADMLGRLRERFQRGRTVARGTGLGLAVVDSIMTQTGGRLVLASPAPGWRDGFEARLEFTSTLDGPAA